MLRLATVSTKPHHRCSTNSSPHPVPATTSTDGTLPGSVRRRACSWSCRSNRRFHTSGTSEGAPRSRPQPDTRHNRPTEAGRPSRNPDENRRASCPRIRFVSMSSFLQIRGAGIAAVAPTPRKARSSTDPLPKVDYSPQRSAHRSRVQSCRRPLRDNKRDRSRQKTDGWLSTAQHVRCHALPCFARLCAGRDRSAWQAHRTGLVVAEFPDANRPALVVRIRIVTTPRTVACPRCGAAVPWTPESRWRPFCSERCKLIDLGDWAAERFRIPGAEPPDPGAEDSEPAPPRKD